MANHIGFQRAGRVFKLMQNHTHHKITPNTALERPFRLTVSVTIEDASPQQTGRRPPEVPAEQGWQELPSGGRDIYQLATAGTDMVQNQARTHRKAAFAITIQNTMHNPHNCYSSQHTNHT